MENSLGEAHSGGRPAQTETLSQKIASFAAAFEPGHSPPELFDPARIAFIDTLGVMLAGSREAPGAIARDIALLESAAPVASIVGYPDATSVPLAAFCNGVSSHAMDYDFSYALGQSAAPVIPALLALSQQSNASVKQVIAAFIVGCEVASRLAKVAPGLSNTSGWHASGTIGAVAATAACCNLLRLAPDTVANAVGISASLAAGLGINYGTMTKPLHVGQAARNAVVATQLAEKHFTASLDALEGPTGFIRLFAPPMDWPQDAFDDLGKTWDLQQRGVTLKLYPCGGLLHSGIDAALNMRSRLSLGDIRGIHIGVTQHAAKRASRTDYPSTPERAKFSMPYVVSYALLYGPPMLQAFTEEALHDPEVRKLATLVSASADDAFRSIPNQGPARMVVTLADGRKVEHLQPGATGTKDRPLTPDQLRQKFMACATQAVSSSTADDIYGFLSDLGHQSDLTRLWPLLQNS